MAPDGKEDEYALKAVRDGCRAPAPGPGEAATSAGIEFKPLPSMTMSLAAFVKRLSWLVREEVSDDVRK